MIKLVPDGFLEVGEEPLGLAALHLPVLDGVPLQQVVQLHRLVGGRGHFVGAGILAQPEVDVLFDPVPFMRRGLEAKKILMLL